MKNKSTNKDLFITDIDFNAEEEDLHKLFSLCGKIRNISMLTDPRSGLFKGCAFINMDSAAEAKDAINTLDGTRLLERCIVVQAVRPKQTGVTAGETVEKRQRDRRPRGRRK